MPLFYHMPAAAQRLLLSFIYVHREDIPLSGLANFTDALFSAVYIFPSSGWLKMLLYLLKNFCSLRTRVCLEMRSGSGKFDLAARNGLESETVPDVSRDDAGMLENFTYSFAKETIDRASSVFCSLKDDVQHYQNGSSLWGLYYQFPDLKGQQTEVAKETDFPDIETEMNSSELFDAYNMAATQHDDVKILSQPLACMRIV